ncbi:helix-turn-helix domain-containing protein [Methylomagnum sp.]
MIRTAPSIASMTQAKPPSLEIEDIDMARSIGRILRELRKERGLSLNELSLASGVSTSMLSQIENGRSTPTVAVLWKIAKALDVPLTHFLQTYESSARAVLLRGQETPVKITGAGLCSWRTLSPDAPNRRAEFYEIVLRGGGVEEVSPIEEGWVNLALVSGEVVVSLDNRRYALRAGDALQFSANLPHAYLNAGREEALMYLVVSRNRSA